MKAPVIARIVGIVLLLLAIASAVPAFVVPAGLADEYIQLGNGYGYVGGLFVTNVAPDAFEAVVGVWGIVAAFQFGNAVRYCRWTAWIFGVLAILGLIPVTSTLFGIAPLYGYAVVLHAAIAIVALYGGYGAGRIAPYDTTALPPPSPVA